MPEPTHVLVRHPNGLISPVSAVMAARKGLEVVEGDALRLDGRLQRSTRDNGRPVKPRTSVAQEAAKKAAGDVPEPQALTPPEGAAHITPLTVPSTEE